MSKKTLSVIIFLVVAMILVVIITAATSSTPANNDLVGASSTPQTAGSGSPATAAKTYTMADVAKHSVKTDCWAAVNGGVYDLTAWISKHPGGEKAIMGLCGTDGSAAFNGQHEGQEDPAKALASFKIGTLTK